MIAPQKMVVGQTVTLQGYADDYGCPVAAVLFSWDGGSTWERHEMPEATADRSVHWSYSLTPAASGEYCLNVCSESSDGRRSPVSAVARLCVREP